MCVGPGIDSLQMLRAIVRSESLRGIRIEQDGLLLLLLLHHQYAWCFTQSYPHLEGLSL